MDDETRRAEFERLHQESQRLLDPDRDAALREDLQRRQAAMPLRYSEPRQAEPATRSSRDDRLTDYQRAAANAQQWEQWLAERLAAERAYVLEIVGEALGEFVGEEAKALRDDLRNQLIDIGTKLAHAQADIANLRTHLATGKEVVDLPAWPAKREAKSVN